MPVLVSAVMSPVTAGTFFIDRCSGKGCPRCRHPMLECDRGVTSQTREGLGHLQQCRTYSTVRIMTDIAILCDRCVLIGPWPLLFLMAAFTPLVSSDQGQRSIIVRVMAISAGHDPFPHGVMIGHIHLCLLFQVAGDALVRNPGVPGALTLDHCHVVTVRRMAVETGQPRLLMVTGMPPGHLTVPFLVAGETNIRRGI